jgi:hypothetical protein
MKQKPARRQRGPSIERPQATKTATNDTDKLSEAKKYRMKYKKDGAEPQVERPKHSPL